MSQKLVTMYLTSLLSFLMSVVSTVDGVTTAEVLEQLGRQAIQQQFAMEEKTRSDGASGIKIVRQDTDGTRPYHSATFSANSVVSIHDHPSYERTLGMGEVVAVLNGVEFQTFHNHYSLVMPSNSSSVYHATEDIPFPDVPPSIGGSLQNQTSEMKRWFTAFKNQDYYVRDYRKYFKPVLCYMEGFWTTNTGSVQEAFHSERHFINASTWEELHQNIRFAAYSGGKSNQENFAYLPTSIINIIDGEPIIAQWNYRILCHPLQDDLPLNRFRVVDDLATRMMNQKDLKAHENSEAARFQLNPFDTDTWEDGKDREGLLDRLMEQIPGLDNYVAKLTDEAFGLLAYKAKSSTSGDEVLNAARYHRWFKVEKKGATGLQMRHRGYSDQNIFMAMTTNPTVPKVCYKQCSKGRKKTCKQFCQRWTYAIPLEIVYLTPLSNWNPLKITYRGPFNSSSGRNVTANGRNGGPEIQQAFDGVNNHYFYRTPVGFLNSSDPSNKEVSVLNENNQVVKAAGSGLRIFLSIDGLDPIRLRYPIPSIHAEGNVFWKELEALKDIILSPKKYSYMFHEPVNFELKPSAER